MAHAQRAMNNNAQAPFGSLRFRLASLAGDVAQIDKQLARARRHAPERLAQFVDSTDLTAAELRSLENATSVSKELIAGRCTALFLAAFGGHVKLIEKLLRAGADPNLPGADKSTPLYVAAQQGHEDSVALLLKRGADVNQAADGGWTPLHVAALEGRLLAARALAEGGADLGLKEHGRALTAAPIALQQGHTDVFNMIKGQTTGYIELLIKSATNLRAADHYYSDPYCIVEVNDNEHGTVRYATHVINRTLNPVWEAAFRVPVVYTTSTVRVVAMDTDDFGEDDLLGASELIRVHRFLQATGESEAMPTPLTYRGEPYGEVQMWAQFHRKAALSSTKSIDDMLAARNHRRSLRDKRRSPAAIAAERMPPDTQEHVHPNRQPQRQRGLSTVSGQGLPPLSPRRAAGTSSATPAATTEPATEPDSVVETEPEPETSAEPEAAADPEPAPEPEPRARASGLAFTPRLAHKLELLQTPRGEGSEYDLAVPRRRKDRRRARSATSGRHGPQAAGGVPEMARPASATVYIPRPAKSKAVSIYRKPVSVWRNTDTGWGTHRVITPNGEHMHLSDVVFDDLRHADPSRSVLRRKGYKVFSSGEWKGRGVAQLCRLFALRNKQLAGPDAAPMTSWAQVRAVLSELIRQARPHLGMSPVWATRAVADGLRMHLGVKWAFEPCVPSDGAGREQLSFGRQFNAAALVLYIKATLGSLHKGLRQLGGVFYEEASAPGGRSAGKLSADPRRTASEPPKPAQQPAQLQFGQPMGQPAVRAQASAAF